LLSVEGNFCRLEDYYDKAVNEMGPTKPLLDLGFTEYEAKTYFTLLKVNPATGYQISKEAGIPRSMVYEALGRLLNRGAILALPQGDTTRYAPVPVNALLDSLRHTYEDALDRALESLSKYEKPVPSEQVWNIEGREAILSCARELIRDSKDEVALSVSDETLLALLPELRTAHDRGVRIRILICGEAEIEFGQVVRHPQAESALQQIEDNIVVVADGAHALVGGVGSDDTAVWTGNRHLVFISMQYIWQEMFTQKVSERLGKDLICELTPEERKAIFGR
jgi:sugar-specific transcriptional regulator TrmB